MNNDSVNEYDLKEKILSVLQTKKLRKNSQKKRFLSRRNHPCCQCDRLS